MSESNNPELVKWNTMEVSPYRYSKLNWMNGIVANRDAVKTYSEIEPVRVPGEKAKRMDGVHVRDKGERL